MGRRVVLPTFLSFALVGVVGIVEAIFALSGRWHFPAVTRAVMAGTPLITLMAVVPIFLLERTRTARFKIEDDVLVLGSKKYPLPGLVSVERDPQVMSWAVKLMGNGGLGAIRGTFRSKRLGKFYAFLTDPDMAVVLRWPDSVVAVSPADPEFFILSARSAAQPQ